MSYASCHQALLWNFSLSVISAFPLMIVKTSNAFDGIYHYYYQQAISLSNLRTTNSFSFDVMHVFCQICPHNEITWTTSANFNANNCTRLALQQADYQSKNSLTEFERNLVFFWQLLESNSSFSVQTSTDEEKLVRNQLETPWTNLILQLKTLIDSLA